MQSTNISPAIRTDHAAIDLSIGVIEKGAKGPGFWKFNCSLLDDENYLQEVKNNFQAWMVEGEKELHDKRAIWEWIKYNIRSHAINFSKIKSQQNKEKETQLENDFSEAARKFEDDPSEDNKSRLCEVKDKLEQSYDEKIKGVIIRARVRWHEYGEKSSKYFLNLEKRNQVKKHIRKLQINSSLTTDPSVILSEAKHFYMNLYQSTSITADREILIENFLNSLDIPKLSEEEKQSCEGNISLEECETILESFKENKSPGSDGIPIEFYKRCWDIIKKPFIECVNESFVSGEMSNTQKKAVITLTEKKGKDRRFIENWRPISLLNVDAKIMSKVIAARIKEVLPNVIHSNQTGYVKDRYIGETVRSIFDIMELTDAENIPGLLIFIDFQKAFDTLEWDFLLKCLEAFNFGHDFMHWVRLFYKNIQSCVINNGTASDYFTLKRGARQGDPLSPYLFVLAVETLAIAIRNNVQIKGIKIGNEVTKVLQFADDITAVLSDINSALSLFQSLKHFEILSGLKVNNSKTEGLWIGALKNNDSKPLGIKWPNEPIKALGVFTYDKTLLYEKNFGRNLLALKNL